MDDGGNVAKSTLRQGDLAYFYIDNSGFFAIPSQEEPLPEHHDSVSHLRAIPLPSKNIPDSFNQRLISDRLCAYF